MIGKIELELMCTSDLPLPSPLSLLGGKVDQDVLPWGTGGKMLWGGVYVCVCMPFVNESIYQVLELGDTVLLKVCLTKS